MKKILAFLLAAVMVLTLTPMTALLSNADEEVVGLYGSVIVKEDEGVRSATVVGTVAKDMISSIDRIEMDITVSGGNLAQPREFDTQIINRVCTTLRGIATTSEATATGTDLVLVETPDVYIYGVRLKGIPVGHYKIDVLAAAYDADDQTVGEIALLDRVPFIVPTAEEKVVLDAYALSSGETMTGVTMTGVVSQVVEISAQYGNATFYMIVAGLTDYPVEAYRVKPADETVDINDVELGATVTVTGDMTNYNGTIEFKNTAKITSIVEPQLSDDEKLLIEYDLLSITPTAGSEVPSTGSRYTEVVITWSSSDSTVVNVVGGVITVDNSALTEGVDVTLTATLSLGEESLDKEFTVAVSAPAGDDVEEKAWTLTFPGGNDKANSNYTGTWTATIDDQVWTLVAINNGGNSTTGWTAVRAGRKNYASVATVTTTINGTVENVVLNLTQVSAATNSIKLYVYNGETEIASIDIDSNTTGAHTFVIPTSAQGAGLTYVLEFDVASDGANGNIRFDSVAYNGYVTIEEEPQISDEDKVEAELEALPETLENGTVLPLVGTTYTDVEIEWVSNNTMVNVDNGVVEINNTLEVGDNDVTVTVSATAFVGDAENTKNYSIVLTAPTQQGGDDPVAASWELTFPSYNDSKVGSYSATWTATVDEQVWTLVNFNNNNNVWNFVKCAGKGKTGTATISTTIGGTVTEFVVDTSKMDYATALTLTIANGETEVGTVNGTTDAGSQTISIPAAYQGEGYTYTLTFAFENTSNTNGTIWVDGVTANGYAAD